MAEARLLPLLGIVSGLMLGLTGAGGSVLAVPLLMAAMGWSLQQAAPLALFAVAIGAGIGTMLAWDVSYVRYRAALLMAVTGAMAAPLGLHLAARLPQSWLLQLFAVALVIVALRMAQQARLHPEETRIVRASVSGDGDAARGPLCRLNDRGRIVWTALSIGVIGCIGAVTGLLSGLLGVGGGFVIVPALRAVTPLSIHSAIATSLMAIALTSGAAAVAATQSVSALEWSQALPYVAGTLAGMLLGRHFAPRITGPVLQFSFAGAMLLTAVTMLLESLQVHA